ncbi:MAG: hypothetical protein KGJ03_04740 [Betaproteobacteria bacterium]|nr:hypothetical protein [Betaproteobacteria bacterium]MBU6511533.1 hypothetical protein [Betaproteobacteria bacterium]MDE1955005.1 hypothetical protein [Betaproteobacteria bacterium]MDE2151109.1 hypothetical protein [Betaproteobacteria bacterium]
MTRILIVGEDALCCALGERLVAQALPGWTLAGPPIDTKGITRLVSSLPRYARQARELRPVLCIGDSDGRCVKQLLGQWLPKEVPDRFVLRLAVAEAESWLLADRHGFAKGLGVPINKLPRHADALADPKLAVLGLVARSSKRMFRDEIVSRVDPTRRGAGYNVHLSAFVRTHWDACRARECSPSLARAWRRVLALESH